MAIRAGLLGLGRSAVKNLSCMPRCGQVLTSRFQSQQPVDDSDKDYHELYHFPYIRHARVISRMKIYQTGITVAMLPVSLYSFQEGTASLQLMSFAVGVSGLACAMLYVMSAFTARLIGVMALSDDNKTIRISHLTFWGKRHDVFESVDNLIPIADTYQNTLDAYIKIKRYNTEDTLICSLKYGHISDKERFALAFGQLR